VHVSVHAWSNQIDQGIATARSGVTFFALIEEI
jgi:hypothetical protein